MHIDDAKRIAQRLAAEMKPHCERLAIAGSIRRDKPEVKDIEIVAVPKWSVGGSFLFEDEAHKTNRLLQWAFDAEARGLLQWIKPGVQEIIPWEPQRDGKYWRGLLTASSLGEDGIRELKIKLDLFLCTLENWGVIYLIRTGAAEFSEAVVTHAKRIGRPCVGGALTIDGEPVETKEEQDVFDLLNLAYVPPHKRIGRASLKAKGATRS